MSEKKKKKVSVVPDVVPDTETVTKSFDSRWETFNLGGDKEVRVKMSVGRKQEYHLTNGMVLTAMDVESKTASEIFFDYVKDHWEVWCAFPSTRRTRLIGAIVPGRFRPEYDFGFVPIDVTLSPWALDQISEKIKDLTEENRKPKQEVSDG